MDAYNTITCKASMEGLVQRNDQRMSTASFHMQIKALCEQKCLSEALDLILRTHQQGFRLEPDVVAEVLLLCASIGALAEGKQLHLLLKQKAVQSNSYLQNNLLSMYTKCGCLVEGQQVFNDMPARDIVSWNAMIAGYAKGGKNNEALNLFWRMQDESAVQPNKNTFVCVLRACAPPACPDDGVRIHACAIGFALESNVLVGSALVEMYTKFKRLIDARHIFEEMSVKDVVLWTLMITGYSECGQAEDALQLFEQMLEGVTPDKVVFFSVLGACTSPSALKHGLRAHLHVVEAGFEHDGFVGSALVDMYAKCGDLQSACRVFQQLPDKDVVSWTALITGHEQQGESEEVLKILDEMLAGDVRPNEYTFVSVVNACASLAALDLGISIHSDVVHFGFESQVYVASALINMYTKCGNEEDAQVVFLKLLSRDTVTWNAIIDGLAQHGNPKLAIGYFEQMKQDEGVQANNMTFVGVLAACNHAGLLEEGLFYYDSMQRDHGIEPSAEHYTCIVDILSRVGHLDAANSFLQKLPLESSLSVLTALLSACRVHGNVDVAMRVVECMMKLDPRRESTYVLLSHVYIITEANEQALIYSDGVLPDGMYEEVKMSG